MSKYETSPTSEKSIKSRLKRFFQNTKRIIKVASKPSKKDYWLVTKICLIGIAVLGALSYVVQLIASVIWPR